MSEFEKQVGEAADRVVSGIDRAVDAAGDLLTGQSGRKIAGGVALGALAAVVLPVSLFGGALIGGGYAAFRQIGRSGPDRPDAPPPPDRPDAPPPSPDHFVGD